MIRALSGSKAASFTVRLPGLYLCKGVYIYMYVCISISVSTVWFVETLLLNETLLKFPEYGLKSSAMRLLELKLFLFVACTARSTFGCIV